MSATKNCIDCKYFDWSAENGGVDYGYCERLNNKTFIEIETKYPEFIEAVHFTVKGDFGCALWEEEPRT